MVEISCATRSQNSKCLHDEIAAKRHGVTSIHCEIEQGHLELGGICQGWPKIERKVTVDLDQWPDHPMQ
jgi:hypothetical protein